MEATKRPNRIQAPSARSRLCARDLDNWPRHSLSQHLSFPEKVQFGAIPVAGALLALAICDLRNELPRIRRRSQQAQAILQQWFRC